MLKRLSLMPRLYHEAEGGAGGGAPATPPTPASPPAPEAPPAPPAKPAELPADVQAKLKEYDDLKKAADKAERERLSEAERLKKDLDDANARTLAAERRAVAARLGLPDELASRLQGGTAEELEADGKKLAALLPAKPATPASTGTPAGGAPTPQPPSSDLQKKEAELAEATKKHNTIAMLRLQREIAVLKRQQGATN